jgi:hypothetical protein
LAALKRDLERHRIVKQQIREIEQTRLERLDKAPAEGPPAIVRLLARVIGIGVETADMLAGGGRCRASECNANREGARTEDGYQGYYTRDGGGPASSPRSRSGCQ